MGHSLTMVFSFPDQQLQMPGASLSAQPREGPKGSRRWESLVSLGPGQMLNGRFTPWGLGTSLCLVPDFALKER